VVAAKQAVTTGTVWEIFYRRWQRLTSGIIESPSSSNGSSYSYFYARASGAKRGGARHGETHFALACGLDQTGSDEPLPVLGHNVPLGLEVGADWPAAEGPTWAAMASMNSRSFSEISDSADSTTPKVFRRWAAVMARRTLVSSSFQASLLASTQKVVANKLNQEEAGGGNTDSGSFVKLARFQLRG
jgi:hypothetical protein